MAGIADLLAPNSGFANWVAGNRGRLGQIGAGLASGQNFSAGLANAAQGLPQGAQIDDAYATAQKAEAERQNSLNATIEYMREKGFDDLVAGVEGGGLDMGTAWGEALRRSQPGYGQPEQTANQRDFLFAQQNGYLGSFSDWVNSGGTGGQVGTTIYTGRDDQGNLIPMQVGQGGFVRSPLPEGVTFDPGALNAERAYGNQVGSGRGKAEVAAPESIANAQRTLTQIQQLKDDPGLWWSVGGFGWTPNAPGNPQAGTISRIEQLQGAAFLDAFESLRGGGQITEVEGAKATNAIARLQRSQSYDDFRQALSDLEEVIQIGLDRAIRQSQGGSQVPSLGGATSGTNYTEKYGLE